MGEKSWNVIPEELEGAARVNAVNRREFLRRSAYTAGLGVSLAASLSPSQVLAHAIRAQRSAAIAPTGDPMAIDHFVILMMENRSFDHYFGWLGDKFDPSIVRATQHMSFTDAQGKVHDTQHHAAVLGDQAQWQGCGFGDPGHGWDNGRAQYNGGNPNFIANGSGNDDFALSYFDEGEL